MLTYRALFDCSIAALEVTKRQRFSLVPRGHEPIWRQSYLYLKGSR